MPTRAMFDGNVWPEGLYHLIQVRYLLVQSVQDARGQALDQRNTSIALHQRAFHCSIAQRLHAERRLSYVFGVRRRGGFCDGTRPQAQDERFGVNGSHDRLGLVRCTADSGRQQLDSRSHRSA